MSDDAADPIKEIADKMGVLGEYDVRMLEAYQRSGWYVAQRAEGMARGQAQTTCCEIFGHDVFNGRCLCCGLGQGPKTEEDPKRQRLAEREAWLSSRARTSHSVE